METLSGKGEESWNLLRCNGCLQRCLSDVATLLQPEETSRGVICGQTLVQAGD